MIIATGKTYKKLGIPGEKEYERRGVAYCATCDAPFYAGKTVAVAGGGNSAFEYAQQLMGITKKTYIINLAKEPTADQILQDRVLGGGGERGTHELFDNYEITGDRFVQGIKVRNANGDPGSERYLAVDGVFVAIGLIPNTSFTSGLGERTRTARLLWTTVTAPISQGFSPPGTSPISRINRLLSPPVKAPKQRSQPICTCPATKPLSGARPTLQLQPVFLACTDLRAPSPVPGVPAEKSSSPLFSCTPAGFIIE